MLGRKSLLLLIALTVAAGLAAWGLRSGSASGASAGVESPERLFPGLADRINDIEVLTISGHGQRFTLRRTGDEWGADEKDGHRVRFERLKPLLVGLSELRPLERKTSSPALHGKLGLQAPDADGSQSVEVTVLAAGNAPLASLIVGNAGPAPRTRFVRKSGDDQAWLVQGELEPEPSLDTWIDTEILRLDSTRVASVTVTHPDGEVVTVAKAAKDDPVWTLQGLPDGHELKQAGSTNRLAESLQWLDFEDVAAASRRPLPETERATTVFDTFDGLRVTLTLAHEVTGGLADAAVEPDGEAAAEPPADAAKMTNWLTLSVSATESASETVRAEAEQLQARLAPWVYQVGDYLGSALRPRMADLTQPKAEEPAAVPGEPGLPADPAESVPAEAPADPPSAPPADDGG
jgi:hypothetical protein